MSLYNKTEPLMSSQNFISILASKMFIVNILHIFKRDCEIFLLMLASIRHGLQISQDCDSFILL